MSKSTTDKTILVLKVLRYAREHDLDISNKEHVQKMLELLDTTSAGDNNVDQFMRLLRDTDTFMEMTEKKKTTKTSKLPN